MFRDSDLDLEVYALPMAVPGKKILQYVFTLRKNDENSIFNVRISIHISKFTIFPTLFASFAVQNACTTSNVFAVWGSSA